MFAVFFVQTCTNNLQENADDLSKGDRENFKRYFGTVVDGTVSLFQAVSGGQDWGEIYDMVDTSFMSSFLFIALVLFFHIALLNIVTSVFLEKTMGYARPDAERLILMQNQKDIQDAKDLRALVEELDDEHTGHISFAEFKRFMDNERFRLYFEVRGIDVADAEMFFDVLVAGMARQDLGALEQDGASKLKERTVDFGTFIDGCFRLKGSASAMDLRCLDFEIKLMHANQERFYTFAADQLQRLETRLPQKHSELPRAGKKSRKKSWREVLDDAEALRI